MQQESFERVLLEFREEWNLTKMSEALVRAHALFISWRCLSTSLSMTSTGLVCDPPVSAGKPPGQLHKARQLLAAAGDLRASCIAFRGAAKERDDPPELREANSRPVSEAASSRCRDRMGGAGHQGSSCIPDA